LFEEEFSVDVKEGQILIFPSMYLHCSKLNMSDDSKLIINKGEIVIKFSPNLKENDYQSINYYDNYSIIIKILNERKIDVEFVEKVIYFKTYN
jgi:hypothetical protein